MPHIFVFFVVRFSCLVFFLVYTFLAVVPFIPAYQVEWRVEFPRLLCGRSNAAAAICICLLLSIVLLMPFFVGLMVGSASIISFSLSSIFIFVYSEGNTSTILHYFSLSATLSFFSLTGYCVDDALTVRTYA